MTASLTARPNRVAILTVEEDLHAYAIRQNLADRHGIPCDIIETDRLADSGGLDWSPTAEFAPLLPVLDGQPVDVRDLGLIWWRRPSGVSWKPPHRPKMPDGVSNAAAIDIITNDCRSTLAGLLFNEFHGVWVSHPDASRHAENKLIQLRAAHTAGLRYPRTLVSQNPDSIRKFCAALSNQVVVKTVSGTYLAPLTPGRVDEGVLASDAAMRLSPAIYQEIIPGTRHLRVHMFGDEFHAALIRCEHLDWRFHLEDSQVEPYRLPLRLRNRLAETMRLLNLNMGVIDLKLTPEGEPVWLEVNPQGQFLFIEGLAPEMRLTDALTDFFCRELEGQHANCPYVCMDTGGAMQSIQSTHAELAIQQMP